MHNSMQQTCHNVPVQLALSYLSTATLGWYQQCRASKHKAAFMPEHVRVRQIELIFFVQLINEPLEEQLVVIWAELSCFAYAHRSKL